ncbi:hypothetical protein [Planctomicrobium piriforme]|nr:hypothetical protein [Planctomicrobium piriforme]
MATGCGTAPAPTETHFELPRGGVETALTDRDVDTFLKLLQRLPGGQAPEFAECDLPTLNGGPQLPQEVEELRQAMRLALLPERQVQHWQSSASLQTAFERLHVDPQAFAALTLRVSCAWSALTIPVETRTIETRRRLDLQIIELTRRLERETGTGWECSQKRQVLEELVALSEFLRLIESVPEQSLQTVAAHQTALRDVLPPSTLGQISAGRSERGAIQPTAWHR